MKILIALTYYRPHHSGLTIYSERLAKALTKRGHQVTVLTSRFDPNLKSIETLDGVRIIRLNVLFRASKGVIMPSLPYLAYMLAKDVDIINVHAPQVDAAIISLIGRFLRIPVVLTYQCDLLLPQGLIHRIASFISNLANHISARNALSIVHLSEDYAENSRFLSRYKDKIKIINPPVELVEVDERDLTEFKSRYKIDKEDKIIGMVARFASEKGVEYLIKAMPEIIKNHPNARVLFVGPYKNIVGEERYYDRMIPMTKALDSKWQFLGLLSKEELACFYNICHITVLPSTNSTEALGIVQLESMYCGTPVVASNIPGVRQPITITKMGLITEPEDSISLANAVVNLLDQKDNIEDRSSFIKEEFSPDKTAKDYEELFQSILSKTN